LTERDVGDPPVGGRKSDGWGPTPIWGPEWLGLRVIGPPFPAPAPAASTPTEKAPKTSIVRATNETLPPAPSPLPDALKFTTSLLVSMVMPSAAIEIVPPLKESPIPPPPASPRNLPPPSHLLALGALRLT